MGADITQKTRLDCDIIAVVYNSLMRYKHIDDHNDYCYLLTPHDSGRLRKRQVAANVVEHPHSPVHQHGGEPHQPVVLRVPALQLLITPVIHAPYNVVHRQAQELPTKHEP